MLNSYMWIVATILAGTDIEDFQHYRKCYWIVLTEREREGDRDREREVGSGEGERGRERKRETFSYLEPSLKLGRPGLNRGPSPLPVTLRQQKPP